MKITITRKQWRFIESDCDETLFGGAAGGGKSYGIVINALLYALKYPGSRQLVLRRTLPELNRSIVLTSQRLFPTRLVSYSSSYNLWRFANGSRIEFGYCDHESDVMKYQSAEYDTLYFDELTHFTASQYTYLLSRLRGVNNFPKQVKCATNPGGVGHFWVRERFVTPQRGERPMHYGQRRRLFIPARVYDNAFLMASDPGYVERLRELPELRRRALLEGDWDLFAGQFFPEYRAALHGMRPFAVPGDWRRFVSIDWGYNDPCAVLWHAVADGHVYTYRELYVRQMTASSVAAEVKRLSGAENIGYYVASPDMWQRRGADSVVGENIADSFAAQGLHLLRADNARIVGWQRVREYLALAPDGWPYWRFFPELCPNLARTLPALIYDSRQAEDAAQGEDHAPESLRYALMSRPRPAQPAAVKSNPLWMFGPAGDVKEQVAFLDW